MKNKKFTYVLGAAVIVLWGMILYRVIGWAAGGDDPVPFAQAPVKNEPYNDYAVPKDTTRLLLNYRDPFREVKEKDTAEIPVKKLVHKNSVLKPVKPATDWGFIKYSGYIHNPGSKKLIALVTVSGKNLLLSEGETKDQVKLIKNMRDSIRVSFNGQIKCISIK